MTRHSRTETPSSPTAGQTNRSGPVRLDPRLKPLSRQLWLTRVGLACEAALRAFWPVTSVILLTLALVMLGVAALLPLELLWGSAVVLGAAILAAFIWGIMRLQWPSWLDAQTHLDATLPGRPIAALLDSQAIGTGDAASADLWALHQKRMAARAAQAVAPKPNLRLSTSDPFGLRFVATLFFAVALLFGSILQVGSLRNMAPGTATAQIGPTWEGWLEPPRYTGLPVLYLSDQPVETLHVPQGSKVTLRFYGEIGDLTLAETVSARTDALPSAADPDQSFDVLQDGQISIQGPGGRDWQVAVQPDAPPRVAVAGQPEVDADGSMQLPFTGTDDYGIELGQVRIELDQLAMDRRHGLALDPEPREPILLDLPLPLTGDRRDFTEILIENFSEHPWANLPVTYHFSVEDAAQQTGASAGFGAPLAARRFFGPAGSRDHRTAPRSALDPR